MYQVLAIDKYKVVVLMEPQQGDGFYMTEMAVEEDYPHRVSSFSIQPLET